MGFFLSKRWRTPFVLYGLMVLELALTVPILALFGIAAPNLYRTKLWQEGAKQGFNSDPTDGLYAAANYRPYHTPLVWSQFLTNFNLIASVLGVFLLLTKCTMHILHAFIPPVSVFIHGVLLGVYAFSVYGQSAKDLSDPAHAQNGPPWYITKNCNIASYNLLKGYCMQAKVAFVLSCLMVALYCVYIFLSVYNCIPTEAQKAKRAAVRAHRNELKSNHAELTEAQQWELRNLPTPGLPPATPRTGGPPVMTPRTNAFHLLGGTKPGLEPLPEQQKFRGAGYQTGAGTLPWSRGELPLREK